MADYEKKVIEALKLIGCVFVREGKGDHSFWYSPVTNRNVTVDKKMKSRYLANVILKDAGSSIKF
jgi:predicted RNA binding protein YcfA (HicA-like mRNA interferase family)